jgi:16S rRNA (cytidine1402-2'-O)-methyltransferase
MEKTGRLSVVATPIGNLEDITVRALRILGEVDYVLCEDTRVTGQLLHRYDIKAVLRRYDAHTTDRAHNEIIADLAQGKHIALTSDAGTPGISDPGVLLVHKVRNAGICIDAIPGPSAVTTLMSIAGVPGNQFTFMGFAPHKKGRETFIRELGKYNHPVIFFESTHRIMKALSSIAAHHSDTTVYMGRELTKFHEEVLVGTARELFTILTEDPVKQKGEFVLLLAF